MLGTVQFFVITRAWVTLAFSILHPTVRLRVYTPVKSGSCKRSRLSGRHAGAAAPVQPAPLPTLPPARTEASRNNTATLAARSDPASRFNNKRNVTKRYCTRSAGTSENFKHLAPATFKARSASLRTTSECAAAVRHVLPRGLLCMCGAPSSGTAAGITHRAQLPAPAEARHFSPPTTQPFHHIQHKRCNVHGWTRQQHGSTIFNTTDGAVHCGRLALLHTCGQARSAAASAMHSPIDSGLTKSTATLTQLRRLRTFRKQSPM